MQQADDHRRTQTTLRCLGICIGASTLSFTEMEGPSGFDRTEPNRYAGVAIRRYARHPHGGNPKQTLLDALRTLDLGRFDRIAVTGRKFKNLLNLSTLSEPEAVEYAYRFAKPPHLDCSAIVSAGGETFMVYVLNRTGQISNVVTGNKCASGTGEFFLQQLRRLGIELKDALNGATPDTPYRVSGRCAVFCKSDCTHATNKGIPKSRVTAGLCQMMAEKIIELLKKVDRRDIMLVGGTSHNSMMVGYLKEKIENVIIPQTATYFEAFGAALWAMDHETKPLPDLSDLFSSQATVFDRLPPLRQFETMVTVKQIRYGRVRPGDQCLLGLDVGSTTTKAVLLRRRDNSLLASVYLRTNGDPVGASRQCYRALLEQINRHVDAADLSIVGLGVCGSGRQIAGLHALTDGVINEIIAHATAAVFFDPEVDTIFEIGGQDAKYTHVTNGVPSDYAMNEACSAGTGSFLEEAAYETLGIDMEDIADVAVQGRRPPNFNDQCAAFIASDIKNAIHEGIRREDIVAGLVYSVCMNYSNRVKGNRPVGDKILMQGGVCYNRAVPLAMAALVGKPIVVPPEPGLMGAFGVALAVKDRIDAGLLPEKRFDLQTLADRRVSYAKPFICKGGRDRCDRRCSIEVIELDGKRYPFGGACNRYYNLRRRVRVDAGQLDMVRSRQRLIFDDYGSRAKTASTKRRGRIGFNKSFLVNTYYPLYATFFREIGFETVLPHSAAKEGIDDRNAAFCFPAELAHGFFYELLSGETPLDYIFLPHFKSIPSKNSRINSQTCPFVQGEPYFLQATFRDLLETLRQRGTRVLSPLLNLKKGLESAQAPLVETAVQMGISRNEAAAAFQAALVNQNACMSEMQRLGRTKLAALAEHPDQFGVVLFGRPYNAFVDEAHMGIPHKLASRGILTLPVDFLDIQENRSKRHMYWGMGQLILAAARRVKDHPQLFGAYITNFSCGPDSFLNGYFRDIMGQKPSLTLELDSHTADAGLETRIEAFLDVVAAYRQISGGRPPTSTPPNFRPATTVVENGGVKIMTSSGTGVSLTDPRVTLLFPSMGHIATECLVSVFKGQGIRAKAYPPAGEAELKTGRANTSCKECLPLILTTGILLNYYHHQKKSDEVLAYFMTGGAGPCRFGQYAIFMEDLIRKRRLTDTAILSLSSENAYAGMGADFERRGWWAIVVSDVLEDIRSMLLANAVHTGPALELFETEVETIRGVLQQGSFKDLESQLFSTSARLRGIELKKPSELVPTIFLAGEIFVRRDALSRQHITERLAERGFATLCAPVTEWMLYTDYLVEHNLAEFRPGLPDRLKLRLKKFFKSRYERRIKNLLALSGLVTAHQIGVGRVIRNASPHMSVNLCGEAVLTIGSSLSDIASEACGVIAIGPFGCMPNRLAESILQEVMTRKDRLRIEPNDRRLQAVLSEVDDLPFLAIESDGSPFPQLIEAKLETFCLRAKRLHHKMVTYN